MKTIIIIGASSGIGCECAKLFIKKGWRVAVAARRIELLRPLYKMAPDRVTTHYIDIANESSADSLQAIIDSLNNVDVIFNVAGIGKQNQSLDAQIENDTIKTNALGFTRIIDKAFSYFSTRKEGGQIAAITSIAGTKGLGAAPSYSATKRFQCTYLEALNQLANLRKLNIKFTDIRPGFVKTDLLNDSRKYPMLLSAHQTAQIAVKAIERHYGVIVIDWRYAILTFLWRLIPHKLWVKLPIHN